MKELAMRWRRGVVLGLMLVASAWRAADAQVTFNPSAQLWPSGAEPARSSLALFGSAVQCTFLSCDPAPSFGIDAKLVGPLRIAVAGPRSALQYGLSYARSHLDVATRIGAGASAAREFTLPNVLQSIHYIGDSLRGRAETVYVAVLDTLQQDATRWSSAEARFTWREERWWVTALVGRLAVTRQGAGLWGGLQLGAELGGGASLFLGVASSPRFATTAPQTAARSKVSLGFGFNTGIFTRQPERRPVTTSSAQAAFIVAPTGPGRIRITIRASDADSVEFASDCTQWKPVSMARAGDRWVVDVPALAGLHRANIRMNGGRWIAPPGLASVDDDFAGEVGIFVVQ